MLRGNCTVQNPWLQNSLSVLGGLVRAPPLVMLQDVAEVEAFYVGICCLADGHSEGEIRCGRRTPLASE